MQTDMRKRIAKLASNILNPFLVSLVIILLLSFESASGTLDALKWSLILVAIGILPVFLTIIYSVRKGRLDSIFPNIRQQRTRFYLLSSVCAAAGYAVLHYFKAPLMLRAAFATGISTVAVFMGINLWWKISLHTAFVAALATVLILLYGWIAAISIVLVPLIAWARIELKQHSPAQVIVGALLAALIVVTAFHLFGLA